MVDAPVKQYLIFADFKSQVEAREVAGLPNEKFAALDPNIKRHVQVYYGLFLMHSGEFSPPSEDQSLDFSLKIDVVVSKSIAKVSGNPQEIENQLRVGLLPLLFNDIGLMTARAITIEAIQIARLGLSEYNH